MMCACRSISSHLNKGGIYNIKFTQRHNPRYLSVLNRYKSLGMHADEKQIDAVKILDKLLDYIIKHSDLRTCKGVYLYGSVGSGKTMLMDVFYQEVLSKINNNTNNFNKKILRVHFHKFMLDIHSNIKQIRSNNLTLNHPIDIVAEQLSNQFDILCFDEFQITDIADAWILSRLMTQLWKKGIIFITTSNRPIYDTYKNGVNRNDFVPFLNLLNERSISINVNSGIDYRIHNSQKKSLQSSQYISYFTPLNTETSILLFNTYLQYVHEIKNISSKPLIIPVMMNRTLTVPLGLLGHVCWMTFEDLCKADKGAADYRAIRLHFHTVFIEGIPQLSVLHHDSSRRFITLIDELYDAKIRLIWSAACEPDKLLATVDSDLLEKEVNFGSLSVDNAWETGHGSAATPDKGYHRTSEQASAKCIYILSLIPYLNERKPQCIGKLTTGLVKDEEAVLQVLEGQLSSIQELHFAFKRAASRLFEMSSAHYIEAHKQRHMMP